MYEYDTMNWSTLLHEILLSVFKLLRQRDRRSVRLTCYWWYTVCNDSAITKREKFVILAREGLREAQISDALLKCTDLRSVIEFYGLQLPELSSTVWTQCGHRIKSLLMRSCSINADIFCKIIFHCPNLTRLYMHKLRNMHTDEKSNLDRLIAQQFKHKNLTSFECYDCIIPDVLLDQIFQLCPNIRKLGEDYPVTSLRRLSWIESYTHIKTYGPSRMRGCGWILSLRPRLKELRIPLNLDEPGNPEIIRYFFSSMVNLEKLELVIVTTERLSNFMKELLFLTLENSPKLEHMIWMFGGPFSELHMNSNEFGRLLYGLRHLEYLNLGGFINATYLPAELIQLTKLKVLRLGHLNKYNDDRVSLHIINQCRDLQCLVLELVTDRILEAIIKHHTRLKKLHLNFYQRRCSFAGFTGHQTFGTRNSDVICSLSQLKELEHLTVVELTPDSGALDGFLSEFDFPNLKCFTFLWQYYDAGKQGIHCIHRLLTNICLKAPQLEILQIRDQNNKTIMTANEFINHHITKLSKLSLLEITTTHKPREQLEELGKLFNVCPSLNHITNVVFGLRLSYDHISRQSKILNNTRFIMPECCKFNSFNYALFG